jgi:hypothetical protein
VARPLSLDDPRARSVPRGIRGLALPALAGRGLAPDAAVPRAELGHGGGCVAGPTWLPSGHAFHLPTLTSSASIVTSGLMPLS